MNSPYMRGGGSGQGRRPPGVPPDRVADAAAWSRRSCAVPPSVLPRVWAMAVLLMVGVVAVGAEDVPGADRHRLHLPPAVGRAGSSLYQSTMQYLMDQVAPLGSPARSASYNPDVACMGAVYRRGGGGSVCVDTITAATVVGVALLLQFLFYLTVTTTCPYSGYSYYGGYRNGNITYVITVDNSNTIGVDVMGGDQMLEQDQTQDQTNTQTQTQTGAATQNAPQRIVVTQDQDQTQDQTQMQGFGGRTFGDFESHDDDRGHGRQWTFPSLFAVPLDLSNFFDWSGLNLDWSDVSVSVCPLLGRYLGY